MKEYGTVSGTIKDRPEDLKEFYKDVITEPKERVYVEPSQEIEEDPHNAFEYARETVRTTIVQSDYFIESALEQGINVSNTGTNGYTHHLSKITTEYLNDPATAEYFMEIDNGETYNWIKAIGTAPYAIRQQRALDYARDNPDNKSSTNHAKKTVANFNETIFGLIQSNPYRKMEDLASDIDLAVTHYDPDASGTTYNAILDITKGMRTESACFNAVRESSYGIRRGTAEEDREGIDFAITPPDDEDVMIDIKSSMKAIQEEGSADNDLHYAKRGDRKFVYYLETTDDDFDSHTFRLSNAARIRLRRKILSDIQDMLKLE